MILRTESFRSDCTGASAAAVLCQRHYSRQLDMMSGVLEPIPSRRELCCECHLPEDLATGIDLILSNLRTCIKFKMDSG